MDNLSREKVKILFSQAHKEQLVIAEDAEGESQFSLLRQALTGSEYVTDYTTDILTPNQLADAQILVVGAPRSDFRPEEIDAVKQFVQAGGGLLLVSNAKTMINPPSNLNQKMAEMTGLQFQEYLNYPITFLQVFQPHYITANVNRIKVGKVASLTISDGARPLALTKATRQTVMACANVECGRVVAIGDVGWLTDDLLAVESNEQLVVNAFHWLAARNAIDIEQVVIPETVEWGQPAKVDLYLRNSDAEARLQVECVLESDADAIIERTPKSRSIPPGKPTRMRWTVRPQFLGEQELRLSVHIDGDTPLFFDQLPEMCCLAPGYFTLKIEDKAGKLKTDFETGDYFTVEGVFHWAAEKEQLPCQLELQLDDGLIERGYEQGNDVSRWHLQATAAGTHKLTLRLAETGQSLPALVTVSSSALNRLAEIRAAYVYPLEAEIAERLRQVDESLSHTQIQRQPFKILSPEEFVQEVYKGEAAQWLRGVLAAARREQWYNPELLDLVLIYIAPTYLSNRGSVIPYDPGLASHLAQLHPAQRRYIEYSLLASEESEEVNIKQKIAAYLLHEKFGHGFFYTQTRLGQQLSILQRHDSPKKSDENKAIKLIEDSAIIAHEGFAAWLELTFLGKLDREVRQVVEPRKILLIEDATGLYGREREEGGFFQVFPSRFDSRYREGFEYLDFIGKKFGLRCAVRLFLLATCIEFGITEDIQGRPQFEAERIKQLLREPEKPDWHSHSRLHKITELLYNDSNNSKEAETLVRQQYCPDDCRQSGCPLEAFITERLEWRV